MKLNDIYDCYYDFYYKLDENEYTENILHKILNFVENNEKLGEYELMDYECSFDENYFLTIQLEIENDYDKKSILISGCDIENLQSEIIEK